MKRRKKFNMKFISYTLFSFILEEIEARRFILQGKQRESVSLERDIIIFDVKIQTAELSIRARDITIRRLSTDITGKKNAIDELSAKIIREKESLAQLLRKTNKLDSYTIVEVVLGNKNISEFFRDIESFTAIKAALQESFNELETTRIETSEKKELLEDKQIEQEELKNIQELQKGRIESDKREKREILDITKGQEAVYQEIVVGKERDAAQIRSALFAIRGSDAISFERALGLANLAFEKTGVRPALLLGVIAQESNLGEFVGQCLLTNQPQKGDGKGVNTGRIFDKVMKPDRDVDIFVNILERLGLNPYSMVVSCPPSYGYGGAMGPAQFIPSTWILYEDKIAKITGHNPPNPWDPYDAFMASALLLRDNGARGGTYSTERLAALRYFAGWKNAQRSAYAFYGDEVMALAAKYQRLIDILQGS